MTLIDPKSEKQNTSRGDGAVSRGDPEQSSDERTDHPSAELTLTGTGSLISGDGKAPGLTQCKRKIRNYIDGISAAYAAKRIRDEELYKDDGYESLTVFIEEELNIGTSQWYHLTRGADVLDVLNENQELIEEHLSTTVEEVPLPRRISWTRPLKGYRDDEELVCSLWAEICERLDEPTRSEIKDLVEDLTNDGAEDDPDDDSGEQDEDDDEEPGLLDQAREEHPELLSGLNNGVAQSIVSIAYSITGGDSPVRDGIKTARANLEGLAHREARSQEDGEPTVPACITGSIDPVDGRDVLVAIPTALLTPQMAETAVPIGVPQAQYEVGVPLSHFDGKPPIEAIQSFHEEQDRTIRFNDTNEHVDWADYTLNPITGCLHNCAYCYAMFQANDLQRYKQGFQPTFYPGRLLAFSEMSPPDDIDHPREKNVFVGSMSDVFGRWVPNWMIEMILEEVRKNQGFNYLFLTKFPQKLSQFDFPENAWVGTTVDEQWRAAHAERHFADIDATVKWLSCEPMKERLEFNDLSIFDCVVIGAQESYGDSPEFQPKLDWVVDLYRDARNAGCKVYFKENLDLPFPKELPAV